MVVPRQSPVVTKQRVSNNSRVFLRMAMLVVHVNKRVGSNRGAKVGSSAGLTLEKLGRARRAEATCGGLLKGDVLVESREN